MVTVNINTADGIVNGATGILMQFETVSNGEPLRLWFKFPANIIGLQTRSLNPHQHHSDWTPFQKVVKSFQFK